MKKAVFDLLTDIPEADRADYKLETAAGSANFNKYVLDLDPTHPVALKNSELLGKLSGKDTAHATELQAKDVQIQSLTASLEVAKQTPGLPAGQIAVPVEDFQSFQKYRTLGDFDAVKAKTDEHTVLVAEKEVNAIRTRLEDVAERNGMDKKAFVKLALDEKLQDLLETTELPNDKGDNVKHDLIKTKDDKGADSKVTIGDYVKKSPAFEPFLSSLFLSEEDKKKVKIPAQKTGEPPADKSAAASYLGSTYQRPDKKKE